jgi:hypothetical protein
MLRFALAPAFALLMTVSGCGDDGGGGGDTGTGSMDSSMGEDGGGGTDSGAATDSGGGTTDSGGGTADGGGGMAMGACTNSADMAAIDAMDTAAVAESCGRSCFGRETCVTECVRDMLGVSMECAQCFGDTGSCTTENCLTACLGGDEARCTSCRREAGCIEEFETCSGIPGA